METDSTPRRGLFGKSDDAEDAAILDNVIKNIFVSCDVENDGMVETSKLIEFIMPFLQTDATAVEQLRKTVDPHDSNPLIDIQTFHNYMKEFTLKLSGPEAEDHNVTPREFQRSDEGDSSFVQSTPRSCFGHHLLKGYIESSGIVNTSNCSTYSLNDFPSGKGPDRTVLEEHIQELEYQKKKMAEELHTVKVELASSLEANDNLQGKLDKTLKSLNSERKLNEKLQLERKKEEEYELELGSAKKQVTKFEKLVSAMEMQTSELTGELQEMQVENQRLEEKSGRIAKKNEEAFQEIISLQTEIEVWKHDLAAATEVNAVLKTENRNLQDVIERCGCEIDKLKFEKATMEKYLKATAKKTDESYSSITRMSRSNSLSEYSPMVKHLLKKHTFITPKTMFKLKNPISPLPDSPIFGGKVNSTFTPKAESTPEQQQEVKVTLLDTTNPPINLSGILTPEKPVSELLSPPTIYVVDRTEDMATERDLMDGSKDSDSGDDLPLKLHFMAANTDTNENLQEEMSKVISEHSTSSSDHESKQSYSEDEKQVVAVQSELIDDIQKQSCPLEEVASLIRDYELKISQLSNQIIDLQTQLSLCSDKEFLLLERNSSLEETLESRQVHIVEINSKLSEYHRLESRYRELESKVEQLENENSVKYVKIVDLTIEVDKLRRGRAGSLPNIEEDEKNLEEILNELKKQKEEIELEKIQLEDTLRPMEEEGVSLKIQIETLSARIMDLEESNSDLEHDKSTIESEKDVMKSENENLHSKNSTPEASLCELEESIHKLETENKNIGNERNTLRNANIVLHKQVETLRAEALEAKSSNSTHEKEQRDLIELSFKLKLENLEKEKNIIYEDRQRLSDEIVFVNQERDNMLQEIRRLRKQLRYKDEEFEMQLEKTKKDLNNSDAEKQCMQEELHSLKRDLQDFCSLKFQHDQLTHRCERLKEDLKLSNGKLEENLLEISSLKEFQDEYECIQDTYRQNSEEILVLKSEKDELNSQIKQLRMQLHEYKLKLEEYSNIKEVQSEKLQKTIIDKNDFQNKVKKLKTDLSGLVQKNQEITLNLEKAKSESILFRNDKYSLQREHERLKEKLKELEDLQGKYLELSKTLEKNKKEYDILRVTNETCEQNRKELNQKCLKDLANYHMELSKIQKENEDLQRENFDLRSKINRLDGEIFQLKEKISYYHNDKHDSDEIKYNLIREKQDLISKLEITEINSKKQDIEYKQLSMENFDLKIKIEKSETIIASYSSMRDKLKATNEELNKLLQNKDCLISEVNAELDSLKETNRALCLEVEKLMETIKEFEAIRIRLKEKEAFISEIQNETMLLKETKQDLNEDIFLYKEMCENYKHKLENIEGNVRKLEGIVEKKDGLLKERELKIDELQKEIDENLKYIRQISAEFEELKGANGRLEEMKKDFEEGKKALKMEMDNKRKLIVQLDESQDKNMKSHKIIEILENNIKDLKREIQDKTSEFKLLKEEMGALIIENKTLQNLLDVPVNLIERLRELSEENELLREECKKFCIQDKVKMIEETNKSFSDALQKIYTAEKKISETEEDFSEYCQREIEKYKVENAKFKDEIASLLEEKGSIIDQLKDVECENEAAKNEVEGFVTQKRHSNPTDFKKWNNDLETCEKCKSESKLTPKLGSNFNKLNIRKEKLEEKVRHLEKQLHQEKECLAAAVSQKNLIEKEMAALKSDNVKLQTLLQEVENQIERLNADKRVATEQQDKIYTENEMNDLVNNLEDHKEKMRHLLLRLEEEECAKIATFNQLHQLRESLSQKRCKLESYTLTVATSFKVPDGFLRKMLITELAASQVPEGLLHIDKEICQTWEQMDITANVLDYMATRKIRATFQSVGCQTEGLDNNSEQRKPGSSTFTLKRATLVPKQNSDPAWDICRLENLRFASSGDAGRSRDLGILFSRHVENAVEHDGNKEEELREEDASPTLNDDTLEDMGLLQQDFSTLTGMSDEELKDKFDKISIALTVDGVSLRMRYSNQALRLTVKERQHTAEVEACKKLLEESLGGDHLTMALRHLESVSRCCDQACASATLFGSLKQEQRMASCVGLMIHYAACLKRRLEDVEEHLRYIGQQVKITGHHHPQLQLTDLEVVTSVRSANMQSGDLWTDSCISPRPTSRAKQMITRCLCIWVIFITTFCLVLLSMLNWDGDSVYYTLPWSWRSFDDPWAPFVKKKYMNGPPPT